MDGDLERVDHDNNVAGDDPGREPGGGEDLQAVVGPAQGGLHRL